MSTTQLNGDYVINHYKDHMDVSENSGIPKSSILIGFSIINHPFWGPSPIFGNIHIRIPIKQPGFRMVSSIQAISSAEFVKRLTQPRS